jgi:thiol-disulfide isomerase/thioredoxin
MRIWSVVLAAVCGLAGVAAQAQSYSAFGFKPPAELTVPAFSDDELTALLTTLDRLAGSESDALWQFGRRLQTGRLSAPQEARVLTHLDGLAERDPKLRSAVAGTRRMVQHLMAGKPAPEISGADLDGQPFKLSDYRGKVVALVFSSEWCAICRTMAPYERFLIGRYDRWPFALLSVETGSSREAVRAASLADHLAHRSWWDAADGLEKDGPIAESWNVIGWPATYVIDGAGIIRFVNVRDEDLLRAVRQLVDEQVALDDKARLSKKK